LKLGVILSRKDVLHEKMRIRKKPERRIRDLVAELQING
jgi:hypothetical protein